MLSLKDVLKYPTVSGPEFSHLFQQWKQGDSVCREQLVLSHLQLVAQLARGPGFDDRFQTGVLALLEALEQFQSGSHMAFTVFVTRRIQTALDSSERSQVESRKRFPQGWQDYRYESEETVN